MERIYVPGYDLIKAGVILMDLIGPEVQQCEFGFDEPESRDHTKLMSAMDAVNQRFGKGSIHVGSTGQERPTREWGCAKSDGRPTTPPVLTTYQLLKPDTDFQQRIQAMFHWINPFFRA
ncbi:DUF4113 domain-containing protein [Diaphorobacter sp. HDW4B]|nr:DUF4113 domain-containing protein [Diaphorobacter sp. HDW4B]QIL73194.1 DUF4113 domain-containing protein [Diaphorobacter sp. HDW4B]